MKKTIKVLAINSDWGDNDYRAKYNRYGGVGYYRLIQPLTHAGVEFDFYGPNLQTSIDHTNMETMLKSYRKLVSNYDVVVTKMLDNPRAISTLFGVCDMAKVPVVMDLDDNFLEVLESQPAHKKGYEKGGMRKTYASAGMSFANALFVSTEPLKEYFSDFLEKTIGEVPPIYVLPNYNNASHWDMESPKNTDKTVIGWHGSITHDADLALVLPTIAKLMDEYPDLELELLGGVTQDTLTQFKVFKPHHFERVKAIGGTKSWDGFPELLMSMKWDIGIAPLVDCEFNRGKSHIKWMELAMKEIPVVASNVYPYKVIEDARTGFLVEDDWYTPLKKLIEDKALRALIGKAGKEAVLKNWQYRDHAYQWKDALTDVIKTYGTDFINSRD